ncbi:MAG: fasciclin domain-containing protein [Myxococcota bacterium]
MTRLLLPLLLVACAGPAPGPTASAPPAAKPAPAPAPAKPAAPKADHEKTVADVAVGSPDHTTLVKALQTAGLVDALASPGGIYTVFAPTNAAFEKLPPGTVDGLLAPEKREDLKKILKHHAAVPIVPLATVKDGDTLTMSDGTKVTFRREGDTVRVDDAKIVGTVQAMNGVVYVVDGVLTPPG